MNRSKTIDPLSLPWQQARLFKTHLKEIVEIVLRPAKEGELIDGEICEKGDMVDISNPEDPFRMTPADLRDPFYDFVMPTRGDKIKSIEKTQTKIRGITFLPDNKTIYRVERDFQKLVKAVRVYEHGYLPAPKEWKGHPGWYLKPGDYVIETKDGYISDPKFKENYRIYHKPRLNPYF